jgi:choice-of-anchor B domain-containing protein
MPHGNISYFWYMRNWVVLFILFNVNSLFAQNLNRLSQHFVPQIIYDIYKYEDSVGNKYVLISGNGLNVFDVNDPFAPQKIAYLPDVAHFDIKVWNNYAYTVNGSASGYGHIIDISNPYNPLVKDSFPSAHNIFIDTLGYMFAEVSGLKIYTLNNDPLKPELIWDSGDNGGHDCFRKNNLLYDFHGKDGTKIYDITNPQKPILLSTITHPDIAYHHSGWVSENNQFLFICDELAKGNFADITVWDIADFSNPYKINNITDTGAAVHNLYIKGNYAYVSYYSAGLRVYDITNPYNIFLACEYNTSPTTGENFTGNFGIYVEEFSEIIYASDRDSGLMIFASQGLSISNSNASITNDYILYPNPVDESGKFSVYNSMYSDFEFIMIFDNYGRIVYEKNNYSSADYIDISILPAGFYFLTIKPINSFSGNVKLVKR